MAKISARGKDIMKLFLLEWFILSLVISLFMGIAAGIVMALLASIVLTIACVLLYWKNWDNLMGQMP